MKPTCRNLLSVPPTHRSAIQSTSLHLQYVSPTVQWISVRGEKVDAWQEDSSINSILAFPPFYCSYYTMGMLGWDIEEPCVFLHVSCVWVCF